MAELLQCDGCGLVSPDKDLGHIANCWTEITVQDRREKNVYVDTSRKILLCEDCLPKPENNYNVKGWAKSLLSYFAR